MKSAACAALVGLLALPASVWAGRRDPVAPEIPVSATRLSSRVLVLECLDVNVTAVATSRGIVLVDTGRSPRLMEAMARRIEKELGRRGVRYIINTHLDPDHCAGNQVFPEATVVAHENGPEFLRHNRADSPSGLWFFRERLGQARVRLSGPGLGPAEADSLRGVICARETLLEDMQGRYVPRSPTLTVRDRLCLELGDVRFELIACGRAHTNNDLLVYVPQERLLMTGDLFCGPDHLCFAVNPLVDAVGLCARFDSLLAEPSGLETVVPGHGRPFSRSDLNRLLLLLRERPAGSVRRKSAAATLDTLISVLGVDAARARMAPGAVAAADSFYGSEEEFQQLARTYRWMGRLTEAVSILKCGLTWFPKSPLLLQGLGSAHYESGDTAAAIDCYQRSLALMPENRAAMEMLKLLRR